MSDSDRSARPRQLTMAGGFVIGGSIFLVLSVFDTITSLHTVEMREEVTEVLSSPTGEGLGLSVSDALAVMRVGLMVAGACAAAAAVLGFYVFQRNKAARMALTVLAVPILLTAPLTGGLVGALVAAATLMLWSGPARDWFAGRPVRQVEPAARESKPGPWEQTMPPRADRPASGPTDTATPDDTPTDTPSGTPSDAPAVPPASSLSSAPSSTQPGAMSGYGDRTPDPRDPAAGAWLPPSYAAVVRGAAPPVTVKVACFLTWVFSGVVALLYLGMLVALVAASDRMVDFVVGTPEWERANLDEGLVLPVLWVGALIFLGWALGACLLAWFTWRRHNWARWVLVASAAATVVAAFFAFPVGLLHQLAAALTIGGLLSMASREWFADHGPSGPPGGPQQPGAHGWPPQQYPSGPPPSGPSQGQQPGPGPGQPPPGGKPPVW